MTFLPAEMIFWRDSSLMSGTGKVFHVSVAEKLRSDFSLPPTVLCHVMNIDEDISENNNPSGSSAVYILLPAMVSGDSEEAV